jgi:hypothetical protein
MGRGLEIKLPVRRLLLGRLLVGLAALMSAPILDAGG